MTTARISKRTVDSAVPKEKAFVVWDSDLKGFGLRVSPRGRKTYFLQYRLHARRGQSHRITIGPHGPITPDMARGKAKLLLGKIAMGGDPKRSQPSVDTFLTVSETFYRYLETHVEAKLKPRTAEEYRRTARLHILPVLGALDVTKVTRSQIEGLIHDMRQTPTQANRTLAVSSAYFSWLEERGYIAFGGNPCRRIRKFKEIPRERYLSEKERQSLIGALSLAEAERQVRASAACAIRLLMFTGARKSEILTLRWEDVDLEHHRIRLQDSKTGKKTIYLNAPAIDVLDRMQLIAGNPYVCPGEKPGGHLVNLQKPWSRICAAAQLTSVRIHDLRHTFASVAVNQGKSLPQVGALLGHKHPQTTARYAHLEQSRLQDAANEIGEAF